VAVARRWGCGLPASSVGVPRAGRICSCTHLDAGDFEQLRVASHVRSARPVGCGLWAMAEDRGHMRAAPEPLGSPCDTAAGPQLGALDPAARVLVICENQRELVIAPGNRGSFCAFVASSMSQRARVGGSRPSASALCVLPIFMDLLGAGACL